MTTIQAWQWQLWSGAESSRRRLKSSYTPRHATNWHVLQSGTLLRFTVTYVSLTTLKQSGIAMPTSTGLLPMKTWIDWPVWTFTNFILKFLNFTTMVQVFIWLHVDLRVARAYCTYRNDEGQYLCNITAKDLKMSIIVISTLYCHLLFLTLMDSGLTYLS